MIWKWFSAPIYHSFTEAKTMPEFEDDYRFDTLAVRAGQVRTAEGEHSEPVFTTSSYVFASAAEAAARFSGEQPGNIYSRFTNPTVRTFEQRLAALEGAESCVATASGMAAIKQMAELAHQNDCLLVVDNCFCTPALQQPNRLGADIVIHSATKFLDGQGRGAGRYRGPENGPGQGDGLNGRYASKLAIPTAISFVLPG
jgi:O-acetylhomoserine/O-acetylserine sulfhydrylase-like pyridoxal-dependent enzyme